MHKFLETCFIKSIFLPEELGESLAEIAVVGRSNVGKSTIINALCEQKELALTSQTPGRTRTINVFQIKKNKWLVDLPGYGYAEGPKDKRHKLKEMVSGYLQSRTALRLVLLLIDGSVGPTKLDEQMSFWLQQHSIPYCVVANKVDRLSSSEQFHYRKTAGKKMGISETEMHWISAKKNIGIGALRNFLTKVLDL